MCERPGMSSLVSDACDMLPEELQPRGLLAEVDRLRALVKAGERAIGNYAMDPFCPWCGATRCDYDKSAHEPHAADCPAFTPDGVVR